MSLYLKYRPKNFSSLVGQDFISETFKSAICKNRLVGAYIFCGPRGTGKTSTARILAKTINCLNLKGGEACLKCEICNSFSQNSLIDIVEIDAASYTGVDNIREIIEKAQFLPSKTKYKVYIIDEVHMLSKGAFNALLKILEEPPSHIKFILATTEIQKVPDTIISRCQRYDFKKISIQAIKKRLEFISSQEGIKVDELSYDYISRQSLGGLRDAIKVYEQLIENKEINYDDIIRKIGILDEQGKKNFLEKLLNKDVSIIKDLEEMILGGKNMKLILKEILFYTKDKAIDNLLNSKDSSRYIDILEILENILIKIKNSTDENTTIFIGVLKIIEN